MEKLLQQFKEEMEKNTPPWDGDNSGTLEDLAHIHSDIMEKIGEIEVLLKEFDETATF